MWPRRASGPMPRSSGSTGRKASSAATSAGARWNTMVLRRRRRKTIVFQRAPADVAAEEAFRPVDPLDRGIGPLARLGHIVAVGADVEHPAAGGDQAPVLAARGAG